MLSDTPQFTPFGNTLSSMFSPTAHPFTSSIFTPSALQNGNTTLSVDEIMKSSFVPTPHKIGPNFSPESRMNLTSVMSDRQTQESAQVPMSMEKKRKVESSGSYFKRMGSPTYGIKKENIPPSYIEKPRVSHLEHFSSTVSMSYMILFLTIIIFCVFFKFSGHHAQCQLLRFQRIQVYQGQLPTLLLDLEGRGPEASTPHRKVKAKQHQQHTMVTNATMPMIYLCITFLQSARCKTLEVPC